jgi:hypothetical protein
MKYLLGIGFVVTQKYRKDPIVRVNIDNRFIDEFSLDDNPDYDKEWLLNFDPWIYKAPFTEWDNHHQPWLNIRLNQGTFPKKFNIYVLDEKQLKDKKQLVLDIQNSDSNYTNGFMTKSTLLDFRAFLIPFKYLKFFYHDGFKMRKEFNDAIVPEYFNSEKYSQYNTVQIKGEKRYYMTSDRLARNFEFLRRLEGYPFAYNSYWNGELLDKWSFGGDGKLTVNLLTKKSGIVMFDQYDNEVIQMQKEQQTDQYPGFYISHKFFRMVHENMFDKYLYNENQ